MRKTVSLRTERAYKANKLGEVAQRTEAQGSSLGVNVQVVQWKSTFLSGETSTPSVLEMKSGAFGNGCVECGGVSRGHSTTKSCVGRPKPVGCISTVESHDVTMISNE